MLEGGESARVGRIGIECCGGAFELEAILAGKSRRLRRLYPRRARTGDVEGKIDDFVVTRRGFRVSGAQPWIVELSRREKLRRTDQGVGARDGSARATRHSRFNRLLSSDGLLAPCNRRVREEECSRPEDRSHQEIYETR